MKTASQKQNLTRLSFYFLGVALLSFGISLNASTGLGVGPIVSIAYAAGKVLNLKFSLCSFILYALMLVVQLIIKGKDSSWQDLLQLPFSVLFSLLMEMYERILPDIPDDLGIKLAVMLCAIVCTGTGISLTLNTSRVVNPADGVVKAAAVRFKKDQGLVKNIVDLSCVSLAMVTDLCFNTLWTSVGIGTVCTMTLSGRVVYLFNRLFLKKILHASGLE